MTIPRFSLVILESKTTFLALLDNQRDIPGQTDPGPSPLLLINKENRRGTVSLSSVNLTPWQSFPFLWHLRCLCPNLCLRRRRLHFLQSGPCPHSWLWQCPWPPLGLPRPPPQRPPGNKGNKFCWRKRGCGRRSDDGLLTALVVMHCCLKWFWKNATVSAWQTTRMKSQVKEKSRHLPCTAKFGRNLLAAGLRRLYLTRGTPTAAQCRCWRDSNLSSAFCWGQKCLLD